MAGNKAATGPQQFDAGAMLEFLECFLGLFGHSLGFRVCFLFSDVLIPLRFGDILFERGGHTKRPCQANATTTRIIC